MLIVCSLQNDIPHLAIPTAKLNASLCTPSRKTTKTKKGNTKKPKVGGIMGGYANLLSA